MSSSLVDQTVDRALEDRRAAVAGEVRRLVDATLALIQETGTLEPTVGDIVRRASLSNQAFYRHFRSKHQLLVAVLDDGIRILASYLAHRMEGAGSPEARVREWVRGMLAQAIAPQSADASRPFALARGRLAEAFPEEVARSEKQLTALLKQAIEEGVRSGEMPEANPDNDSEALYHLTMGWVEARLMESGKLGSASDSSRNEQTRAHAEHLESFAINGLLRTATTASSEIASTGIASSETGA